MISLNVLNRAVQMHNNDQHNRYPRLWVVKGL